MTIRRRYTLPSRRFSAGFSYIEILIASVLIVASLVPAMNALNSGISSGGMHQRYTSEHLSLSGKMEETLAQPFASLDAEAVAVNDPTVAIGAYSDPPGAANRRLVYLSRYDGDNADLDNNPFTGTDSGLLWVKVDIEGTKHQLETLTSE